MDNRVRLSEWETLFLKELNVKVENGVMTDRSGSEKIEPSGVKMKPFLLNPEDKNTDIFMNQKVELIFEGYNRKVILRRYGKAPSALTVIVNGSDVYTMEENELPNGLKKIMVSRGFDGREARIEIIPNTVLPSGEEVVLLTKFSNVYSKGQEPNYEAYITCTPTEIRIIDPREKIYYDYKRSMTTRDFSRGNYDELLRDVINHSYKDYDGNQEAYFFISVVPIMLRAFDAVSDYCERCTDTKRVSM